MDVYERRVVEVLSDSRRFVVPIFQRQYQWREDLLTPFWEDVLAKAEEALDREPRFSHYMGALILAPGSDGFVVGTTARIQVIDGQQRLTTFSLFLAALRDVAGKLGLNDLVDGTGEYLFMVPRSGDSGPDARFRLVPTPDDKALFHLILDEGVGGVRRAHPKWFFQNGRLIKGGTPESVRALLFFVERIEAFAQSGARDEDDDDTTTADDPNPRHRLQALLRALLHHLKLVVITLDEKDDAQVIFESLNSKRQALQAMDLVRNNIFHRASSAGESAEALFDSEWKQFGGEFWKQDAPRAKPKRPRIDHFLSHALTAQTGQETSLRELYAEYRAFATPRGQPRFPNVADELRALTQFAPIYEALERGQAGDPLSVLGDKLNLWEVSTAYPVAFHIAISATTEDAVILYQLLESYIVRRAMLGLTPKNYNKTFSRLVAVMLNGGTTPAVFARAFEKAQGDAVRFPDDGEFAAGIVDRPIYTMIGRKERLTDILWQLECAARTKYNLATPRPPNATIEHIMPQRWVANWPLPDGRRPASEWIVEGDEALIAATARRRHAVQTLGNLTLVTLPANVTASNADFDVKKEWLAQSLLGLNLSIIDKLTWTETEIEARGRDLASAAIRIWPDLPRGISQPGSD